MSGFLLDTNIVSSLTPSRKGASDLFLQWLERRDADGQIFLSVVTIHEIEKGISLLEHKGANAKAASLRDWLSGLVSTYEDKIFGLNSRAAALSGQLEAKAIAAGHHPGMADAMIAGIAMANGLTVITENARHFLPFGASALSPDGAVREL